MDGLDDLVHDDRADTDRPSMATEEQEEDVGRGALDAPNCPRCGSTDTVTDAETDIPGDAVHDYGCDECLFVWGEGGDPR